MGGVDVAACPSTSALLCPESCATPANRERKGALGAERRLAAHGVTGARADATHPHRHRRPYV
eukprot:2599780-Prymnesium_polylepis.1